MSALLDLLGLIWLIGSVLFSLLSWASPVIIFLAFMCMVGAIGQVLEQCNCRCERQRNEWTDY